MTPDRIRAMVNKIPTGARALHLSVSTTTGMQELATWERKEVEETRDQTDGDVASAVLSSCMEYTAGEMDRQKFLIQWRGPRSKPLKSATHWVSPKVDGEESSSNAEAGTISDATVIRELLKAHLESNKLIVGSLPPLNDTIKMLSLRLNEAYQALDDRRVLPAETDGTAPRELTEVEEAEVLQRTEALGKVMNKVPDIIDVGIAALSKWALADRESKASSNGHNKPAPGETRVEPQPD